MKTATTEPNTETSQITNTSPTPAPDALPVAVYDTATVMQALRIAQQEGRDVIFIRTSDKPSRGVLQLPIYTLIETLPKGLCRNNG